MGNITWTEALNLLLDKSLKLGQGERQPLSPSSNQESCLRGASHERKEGRRQEHLLKMIGSGG